jgi:cytoskeletal protein CcmA (bactofilin family)
MDAKPPEQGQDDENALETPDSGSEGGSLENSSPTVTDATSSEGGTPKPAAEPPKTKGIKQKLRQFNLYLLLFVFVLVVAGVIIAIAYFQSQKATTSATLKTQQLTQNTLNQVASSDATIGSSQEVLNIVSSAVFAGKVLMRSDLQIAGSLQIGGTVALNELTVNGTSSLGQVSVSKDLAVTGTAAIQGAASIAGSLQVNGTGTFSGSLSAPQITTSSLQLNSDLILTHHITAGGPSPGHSQGPALGSGGTSSVGGSDTSGSVTVNIGSNPSVGCFITINFAQAFNATPHVLITPIGASAAGVAYYATRSPTSFSICDAGIPTPGTSFGFDYFVVD